MEPRKNESKVVEGRLVRVRVERPGWFAGEVCTGRENVSVSGPVPQAPALGCHLSMVGTWVRHETYGDQFKFETCHVSLPSDVDGVAEFLKSIKEIGPNRSRSIAHFLGSDAVAKILADPTCLVGIQGIGKTLATKIHAAVDEKKNVAVVEQALCSFGFGPSLRKKIRGFFNDRLERVLQEEPYSLVDVSGVSFTAVDRGVLAVMNFAQDHPNRLAAACVQAVKDATQWGHTWVDKGMLTEQVLKLKAAAPIKNEWIEAGIFAAVENGKLTAVPGGYTTPRLARAEDHIAKMMSHLAADPKPLGGIELLSSERREALTDEQRSAVEAATSQRVAVITGGPGRGKTYTLLAVLEALGGGNIAVCAPTGKAAKRASECTGFQATTIHRLIGRIAAAEDKESAIPDIIVIDEFSMVDVELFALLIDAVAENVDHLRFILVGDVDQLPSIGPGRCLADLIESSAVAVTRLTTPMRQAQESRIVKNADLINEGEPVDNSAAPAQDWFFVENSDAEKMADTIVKMVADRAANLGYDPIKDVAVLTPQRRTPLGVEALNNKLRARLNPADGSPEIKNHKGESLFRAGDRVLVTQNDYNLMVVNGDTGVVKSVTPESQGNKARVVVTLDDDRDVTFENGDIDMLTQAWAMTVHKSQGSEYPMVVAVMHDCMGWGQQRNLLYTAVTRGKKTVVVCGTDEAVNNAVANDRPAIRFTRLRELLRGAQY